MNLFWQWTTGPDTHGFKVPEDHYEISDIYVGPKTPEGLVKTNRFTVMSTVGGIYAEAIKLTTTDPEKEYGEDIKVSDFHFVGGYEDCIDCVRCRDVTFEEGLLESRPVRVRYFNKKDPDKEYFKTTTPRTFITIKGGQGTYLFRDIVLKGKCRYPWDISIGDHTIYNKGNLMNLTDVRLVDVRHIKPQRKVRVLVMDASEVSANGGRVAFIRIPKSIVKIWFKILG